MRKLRRLALILFLLPAALFAAGFFAPRTVRGQVFIENVCVFGCNEEEATERLSAVFSSWEEREITVDFGKGDRAVLKAPDLKFSTDLSEVFRRALKVKKGERAEFFLTPKFSLPDLVPIISDLAKPRRLLPQDAELRFSPDGYPLFSVRRERYGRALDEYRLLTDVLEALSSLKEGNVTVQAHFRTLSPAVTVKSLKNGHEKLASFSTAYENSSAERKHNILLAATSLNGTVLPAGESLSFNGIVGERSEENGYLPAKVILQGKYEEGLGGGVCQVSTTLYNAALLSGLKVTEFHPHSLPVSYVPPARDAMVNYGVSDLVVKNPTDAPVFLTAQADGNRITFTFYGTPTGRSFALESYKTEDVPPPAPLVERDEKGLFPSLLEGERLILQRARVGMRAECYLVVTENGVKTRVLLRKNTYLPMQEHAVIGTAPKKAEEGG